MFELPEVLIRAEQMSSAIDGVAYKLLEFGVVTDAGFSVLQEEARRLKQARDSLAWDLYVDRDNAIVFSQAIDKNGNIVVPKITCAGIKVEQDDHSRPPFVALDIAIEVDDSDRRPVARWHVDWANSSDGGYQPGPLVHLQYGGHNAGHRELDHPLKVPRWAHPPMEIILLSEVVVANFFEDEWAKIRDDQTWCRSVALAQTFCYSAYLRKMCAGLSISSKTLLHSMWAGHWEVE